MESIILIGPPGAGKGTAAERVRVQAGYIHVSTGDMLREAVKKGSELGREAEGYMKSGELVPDELMIRLVAERLKAGAPTDKYMFDGFPRTTPQADLLDETLQALAGTITHVFLLEAPEEILIQRLTGRRICRSCGMNFHVTNVPPKQPGICDACGGELYHRPDDQEETIRNRLSVYEKQTEALISRYEKVGLLLRVDSGQTADLLVDMILTGLQTKPAGATEEG